MDVSQFKSFNKATASNLKLLKQRVSAANRIMVRFLGSRQLYLAGNSRCLGSDTLISQDFKTASRPNRCAESTKYISCLEKEQKLATKIATGLIYRSYGERFHGTGIFPRTSTNEGWSNWDVQNGKGYIEFKCGQLLGLITERGTRVYSLSLQREQSRLQVRAAFFNNRIFLLWNRLPENVVGGDEVDGFKRDLDAWWAAVHSELEKLVSGLNTKAIYWIWYRTWYFAFQKRKNINSVGN